MNYRLTCLTPTLVGDGRSLAPIDYMVWKDQVNVLDQQRIFKLLARGPRLESYLQQLKKAQKLDFASWGGFAQSYADRRIPFEDSSVGRAWEQAHPEQLFIPTFAQDVRGQYLPASALKGALRTGYVFSRFKESTLKEVEERFQGERPPRRPGEQAEAGVIGTGSADRMRLLQLGDSHPVATSSFRVYLLRTAALGAGRVTWKPNATYFAEMAAPGTQFTGVWSERTALLRPEVRRTLHWRDSFQASEIFRAANEWAAGVLATQRAYAEQSGLTGITAELDRLATRASELQQGQQRTCLLNLGWGGGLQTKTASLDTNGEPYRAILRRLPLYQRAIQTGLPFPKTRKVIIRQDQPSTLPGWCELQVD